MMRLEFLFDVALWLAGVAHFCLLGASVQLPFRFHWKEDLQKISHLNRKLMWVYYFFTLMTIIAFGVMTFVFHDELLEGERDATALATFIGIYWLVRIFFDCFYFRHSDWPEGRSFAIGHALLMFTFVALTSTYFSLVIWHVCS